MTDRARKVDKALRRIQAYDIHTERLMLELERLEAKATRITADIGGERVQASGGNKLEDAVIEIVSIKEQIYDAVVGLCKGTEEANSLIRVLTDPYEIKIAYGLYRDYIKPYELAEKLGIDEKTLRKYRENALEHIADEAEKRGIKL